ncbi:MAG: hypothetical protein IV086_18690 [Hyphomonadaceae bacterium]|nr:MAG: hypothetical protein FD160_1806 [Caulobacteraceae bacterium]MBT9447725.1 hypothetical protein [Hyphomonadaceae bacterium]TPW04255.1 MAG: hypothetical protein FD124_2694 [Alphaproteobacteria bacterium]
MRLPHTLTIAAVALLAACDPQKPEAPPVEAPSVAEAPTYQALTGLFGATSSTAMGITGDLAVTPERVTLSKGEQLDTAPATEILPTALIAAGGKSFAETYVGPTSLALELRKVTAATVLEGTTPQKVCGDTPVSYLAFAYDADRAVVTMLAFSGAEAPGDAATNSQLCGTFSYGE